MNFTDWRGVFLVCVFLLASGNATAQESEYDPTDDQAAVWAAVERVWQASESGDPDWIETMLSADFMGWPKSSPAPRSKASVRMWSSFEREQGSGVAHELYPLSIVVHGDMAVVHYLYTNAVETRDKKREITNGRYTDVLVRDEGSWKFISWHGGDDE